MTDPQLPSPRMKLEDPPMHSQKNKGDADKQYVVDVAEYLMAHPNQWVLVGQNRWLTAWGYSPDDHPQQLGNLFRDHAVSLTGIRRARYGGHIQWDRAKRWGRTSFYARYIPPKVNIPTEQDREVERLRSRVKELEIRVDLYKRGGALRRG